jgi:Domain of unknown function (DUF4124)
MNFKIAPKKLILSVVASAFSLAATAQWQWVDKDGRKVFSDRAPTADIPEKNILKQPASKAISASPASAPAVLAPASKAGNVKISGRDAQLEARKKQADDEEESKKKAGEEKLAKTKADNCERAKKGLANVQSGVRLSVINAKGEREFMDDDARSAESKRLQSMATSECLP